MEINNRKVLVKALVGSHNYNLNDQTSDKDWKVFVMPTFEELYYGKRYKWAGKIDGDDYDVKDIRDLLLMWSKANIAYLEILVSKETWIDPSFQRVWDYITQQSKYIANNNPTGMVKSMIGMAMEKRKAIEKDLPNEASNEGYKRKFKFGFDSKQLLHIFRLELMLQRYCANLSMLENYDCTEYRKWLLGIKTNEYNQTKDGALESANSVIINMQTISRNIDFDEIPNQDHVMKQVANLIALHIKENL